jgi:hypothetical protein
MQTGQLLEDSRSLWKRALSFFVGSSPFAQGQQGHQLDLLQYIKHLRKLESWSKYV